MLGRAFITNPTKWDGCQTYPAWKHLNPDGSIGLVPAHDPSFGIKNEVAFAAGITIPSILVFITIGLIWSCVASRFSKKDTLLQPAQNLYRYS
jgi:hypothetical protein